MKIRYKIKKERLPIQFLLYGEIGEKNGKYK